MLFQRHQLDASQVDPLACALFLILAFTLAGTAQTAWFRSHLSRPFQVPLDLGCTFRGRRLLGDNKTLRGFVVMLPAASASFFLLATAASGLAASAGLWPLAPSEFALLGAWGGLGFMLGELPNSFLKRQCGVPPGAAPPGAVAKLCCFLFDRYDSIAGMLLAVSLAVPTPWLTWVYLAVIGPAIHWCFSVLLYWWGVKERPA